MAGFITIDQVIDKTTNSRLRNYIFDYKFDQFNKITRPRHVDAIALFKSQSFMYDLQAKPNWPVYAKQFTSNEIKSFRSEVKEFATTSFSPALNAMHKDYYLHTEKHIRGYLDPVIVFDEFQKYGHNDGLWGANEAKLYEMGIRYYMEDLHFEKLKGLKPYYNEASYYEYYKENIQGRWPGFLAEFPYLKTLNLTASSGYDEWNEQNIGFIYDHLPGSIERMINNPHFQTAYCRTQGGKTIYSKDHVGRVIQSIKWKNRYVNGVEFDDKATQSPVTYLFSESNPIWTPYYKSGSIVNDRILKAIAIANENGYYYFASDITGCDEAHTNVNLDRIAKIYTDNLIEKAVDWLVKWFTAGFNYLKNPNILWNPRQMQVINYPEKRTYSLSGHPHIPLFQTLSVLVAHVIAALDALKQLTNKPGEKLREKIKNIILEAIDQIDDVFLMLDLRGMDPKEFKQHVQDFMLKHYGLETNASKFIDSLKGFTILLKVAIGFIYAEGKALLTIDGSQDELSYVGYVPTKCKGMFDKERGTKDDGQPNLFLRLDDLDDKEFKQLVNVNHKYIDPETGEIFYGAKKAVQQLYGSLQSFGPKMPFQLLELIQYYFHGKQVWDELILMSKLKVKMVEREWGFQDHELVLKSVANLGEPHPFRK
jgi:hypothetical protein